jgi:hypothetical protein
MFGALSPLLARLNAGVSQTGLLRWPFFGHQKYLVRTTCSAVVGKCLKVRTAAGLYEAQSHGVSAYYAWHLNGGSKACAGWRWAGDLHRILIFKGGTQRYRRTRSDQSQELLLRDFFEIGSMGDILVLDRSSGPGMTVRYLLPRLVGQFDRGRIVTGKLIVRSAYWEHVRIRPSIL